MAERRPLQDYTRIAEQLSGACARPAEVRQGRADDRFDVEVEASNMLVRRPNQIAVKNLKSTNIASHFPFSKLEESPLQLVPRHSSGTL